MRALNLDDLGLWEVDILASNLSDLDLWVTMLAFNLSDLDL